MSGNKIDNAIGEFRSLDTFANQDQWMNRLHPLVKLFLTILYITVTVSFSRYQLAGLLCMAIYPLAGFMIGEISFAGCLRRLRIVLPLVCMVGIFNPLFDREVVLHIGSIAVTGGVLSMITLMIKGVLTVLASYLLIVTTSIEKICRALRMIHVPKVLVTEILLIYRYVTVLLSEAGRITQAYSLRAPGQKGVAFKAWGPLLGQMLLRSMDRAEVLYESMCIRGFSGEFPGGAFLQPADSKEARRSQRASLCWLLFWTAAFLLIRFVPIAEWLGGLFM